MKPSNSLPQGTSKGKTYSRLVIGDGQRRDRAETSRAPVTEQSTGSLVDCGVIERSETLDGQQPSKLDGSCAHTGGADLPSGERFSSSSTHGATDATPKPPASNTGVEITTDAILHWASFTFPVKEGETGEDIAKWILGHLPPGAEPIDRAPMGYTQGWRVTGGGLVLWRPDRPDMGVHISLPGGLLAMMDCKPLQLVSMVLVEGGKFTRLDIAKDTDRVSMATVRDACTPRDGAPHGNCVTRAKSAPTAGDLWNPGETLYIGKRSSDRLVRFYDKAAEQGLTDGQIWTRCEVEYKGQQAQQAAIHIINGCDLADLVFSAIDFRDMDADSNVSRCPRLAWWADWIGEAVRLSFALPKAVGDVVKRAYNWLVRQVGPTIAFLDKVLGPDLGSDWLNQIAEVNKRRISSERKLMLMGAT